MNPFAPPVLGNFDDVSMNQISERFVMEPAQYNNESIEFPAMEVFKKPVLPSQTAYLLSYLRKLKNQLTNNLNDKEVFSTSTFKNTRGILLSLDEELVCHLTEEDILATSYGTIILDWEKKKSNFSLEIGNHKIGYIFEKDDIYKDAELNIVDESLEETVLPILSQYIQEIFI